MSLLNCVHLAKTAESAEARDRFAHLARTRLAEELERIQAVLAKDGDETEPKRRVYVVSIASLFRIGRQGEHDAVSQL